MGSLYTSQSTSGYNSSPPADDGSAVASNQVKWSTIKTKLADVLKTFGENIDAAADDAFQLTLSGASVTSSATSYQVLSSDQGKLIRATASSITITTPDATSVSSPFVFAILNSSAGNVTIDGSGTQTVSGAANITLPAGQGTIVFTDGSNWFVIGCILSTADLTVAGLTATTITVTSTATLASVAGAAVATQTDQETGTSIATIVTPGRQHFHTSAAKCWLFAVVSATVPANTASYNITSVTDTGVGDMLVTIATDFSSANWCPMVCSNSTGTLADNTMYDTPAAGTVALKNVNTGVAALDPSSWSLSGHGDQA